MSEFVTVSKSDEQFWPMLTGKFSRTHFAQPVRNLYVNSLDETVTFKIIEKHSLSLPAALTQWYSLARNIFLIFPVIGGLAYLTAVYGLGDVRLVIASLFSLQFFLMSLTLYNDYSDYVSGVDRVNEYNSQKPLVLGLIRPYQAKQLALAFLLFSLSLATYCFVVRPYSLGFAVGALLVGLTLTSRHASLYFKGMSLVVVFLLAGPLLVLGYEYLLYETMSWPSVFLGVVFGIHALKYEFAKQVREIYYNSKAKVSTLSTLFGFEKSKYLYSFFSLIHVVSLVFFSLYTGRSELFLLVVVALCFEVYLNKLFYSAASFLSSNLSYCLSLQKLHYTIECSLMVFIFLSPLWLSFL